MAVVSGKVFGVGARYAGIFQLNASGSPAATSSAPYAGVTISGARAFNLTIPDARKITHIGDDRPLQVDYLPPTEALSAELTVAEEDQDVYAILTGTSKVTLGEASAVGLGTSQQGFEPQVGLLLYQQALSEAGVRNWRWILIPRATVYPHPGGFSENSAEHRFLVSPAVVSQHLWETPFSSNTEGFSSAQGLLGASTYRPALCAWLATTSQTSFLFPTTLPLSTSAKLYLTVNGTPTTTGYTASTTQVVFTTAPGNNARVVAFYETP